MLTSHLFSCWLYHWFHIRYDIPSVKAHTARHCDDSRLTRTQARSTSSGTAPAQPALCAHSASTWPHQERHSGRSPAGHREILACQCKQRLTFQLLHVHRQRHPQRRLAGHAAGIPTRTAKAVDHGGRCRLPATANTRRVSGQSSLTDEARRTQLDWPQRVGMQQHGRASRVASRHRNTPLHHDTENRVDLYTAKLPTPFHRLNGIRKGGLLLPFQCHFCIYNKCTFHSSKKITEREGACNAHFGRGDKRKKMTSPRT